MKNIQGGIDAKNTFMAGSSMGGLISMYAFCEYPNIFGGVFVYQPIGLAPLTYTE